MLSHLIVQQYESTAQISLTQVLHPFLSFLPVEQSLCEHDPPPPEPLLEPDPLDDEPLDEPLLEPLDPPLEPPPPEQ